MLIPKETIQDAKEKLGDGNADLIAQILELKEYDQKNMRSLCPFHEEKTPSFIYDTKRHCFHCFGKCGINVDAVTAYMHTGMTYVEACKEFFEQAKVKFAFGEHKVKTKKQYKYPVGVPINDKKIIYKYLGLRQISKETIDYCDVREDKHGNVVFNFYDSNDTLTLVKYRPSHAIDKTKGEIKCWCEKDADTANILFNMNRINVSEPLLVTEGEVDQLAAVESGYKNSVSVPLGANNYGWIEENWEWLEQFDSIILAFDNDEAGRKAQKECIYRLGSWRTKIMDIPEEVKLLDGTIVKVKDINEMLYYFGKEAVLAAILNAKDSPVDSLVDYSDIHEVDLSEIDGIETGIQELDREIMRLFYGTFNILTGINGCVDCETEYFDGRKWKKISEYTSGDMVLQYNKNGTTKLVNPQCYHKYFCNEFYLLKSHDGLVNQKVSPEHNLVLSDDGKIIKINVEKYISKEMYKNKNLKFINTFSSECNIELDTEIKTTEEEMSKVSLMFVENTSGDASNSNIADYIQFDLAKKGYSSIVTNEKYNHHIEVVKRTDVDIYINKEKSADGFKYCFTVPSGMLVLRRNGRINITGNSGKSSFLSQLVAQSIDQNKDVWMYSKELPNYMLKNWQTYIFAGRRHISEYMAQNGSVYYKVNDGVKRAIDDYYRGHLKIYKDGYKNSIQSIKTSMEDSARKFGSKLFIIDNLTAMNFECNDNEKWSKQVDFINWSIDFAQKYHVVVMLVIHPKKIEAMRRLTKLDVQGLGSIVDLAHRLISLYRVSPKEKMGVMKQAGGGWLTKPVEFDVLLDVLKDRMRGREGLAVGLHYDTPSRRFYTNENEFRHQYRWDKTKYEDEIPYPKVNEPEIFGNKELL